MPIKAGLTGLPIMSSGMDLTEIPSISLTAGTGRCPIWGSLRQAWEKMKEKKPSAVPQPRDFIPMTILFLPTPEITKPAITVFAAPFIIPVIPGWFPQKKGGYFKPETVKQPSSLHWFNCTKEYSGTYPQGWHGNGVDFNMFAFVAGNVRLFNLIREKECNWTYTYKDPKTGALTSYMTSGKYPCNGKAKR